MGVCSRRVSGNRLRRITFQLTCLWQVLGCKAQEHHAGSLPDFIGGYRVNEDLCQKVSRDCIFSDEIDTPR